MYELRGTIIIDKYSKITRWMRKSAKADGAKRNRIESKWRFSFRGRHSLNYIIRSLEKTLKKLKEIQGSGGM